MKPIQMVDLVSQYHKIKEEVDREVIQVLESSAYINGPQVHEFQKNLEDFLGVKHVIPCANGTDALQVAMMALELEPGDEVITVDFTFAATVEVIKLLRLTPVIVDVNTDDFNISIEAIKKAITPKTKAIVPVHLFGQTAHMEEIMKIADEQNIYVVEDAAQAIGATYTFSDGTKKKAGTIGQLGATSFFPSKNLGGFGDGGAIFTNDDDLADMCKSIVNHGMGERYHYERVGVNSRLDTLQAAILKIKLKHLNEYIGARQKAAAHYDQLFGEVEQLEVPHRNSFSDHVFHQYTLKVKNGQRDALKEYLNEHKIPAMIYYPIPLHKQNAYDDGNFNEEDFKNTNQLCKEVISLPMHTELDESQLNLIAQTVKNFFNR